MIPENLAVETGLVEQSHTFVLQCNPNVNIHPWKYKFTYIDAAIRWNYDRETWMNFVINIIYRRGKYNDRFGIGQPLIYTLMPRTRVTDA